MLDKVEEKMKFKKSLLAVLLMIIAAVIAGLILNWMLNENPDPSINVGDIYNYGNFNINVNQKVDEIPSCPECPKIEYYPLELYHQILAECEVCEGFHDIETDFEKIKFNLYNNYTIFVDKLPYGERTTVGFCNLDETYCYILPQYTFDKSDEACIELNVSKSKEWGLSHIEKPSKEWKCIFLHDTKIHLDSTLKTKGIRNSFEMILEKNGVLTPTKINLYKTRMRLPNGQFIYFEEFLYNDSVVYGFCNQDQTSCYIKPEYRFHEDNEVCVDAILPESWDADSKMIIVETENRTSCVQDASNQKFLSECT